MSMWALTDGLPATADTAPSCVAMSQPWAGCSDLNRAVPFRLLDSVWPSSKLFLLRLQIGPSSRNLASRLLVACTT